MTLFGWQRSVVSVAIGLGLVRVAGAGVGLQATLNTAQEVPAPTGTSPNAGGTATFTFDDETKALTYTVTLHDLTANPVAAHLHQAPAGQSGGVVIPLDASKTTDTTAALTDALVTALFGGGLYINFHTAQNPGGEVRGQITISPGKCGCRAFPNHGQFVKCVKKEIKKLDKAERKEAVIKALMKAAAKSACGKSKGPKNTVACCLPANPEANIVIDKLCVAAKDSKCPGVGGVSRGATSSCFAANPCSPSGAFLDDGPF